MKLVKDSCVCGKRTTLSLEIIISISSVSQKYYLSALCAECARVHGLLAAARLGLLAAVLLLAVLSWCCCMLSLYAATRIQSNGLRSSTRLLNINAPPAPRPRARIPD